MHTTSVSGLPVKPVQPPLRTYWEKHGHRVSQNCCSCPAQSDKFATCNKCGVSPNLALSENAFIPSRTFHTCQTDSSPS